MDGTPTPAGSIDVLPDTFVTTTPYLAGSEWCVPELDRLPDGAYVSSIGQRRFNVRTEPAKNLDLLMLAYHVGRCSAARCVAYSRLGQVSLHCR